MGRGCIIVLPAFAIAAAIGYVLGWVAFTAAPQPVGFREGTWGIQIMFFNAPGAALALGGGAVLIVGGQAVVGGKLTAAAPAALLLFAGAFLFGYYGIFTVHQLLIFFAAVAEPSDPFLVSRRVAPLAALALAIGAGVWAYLRLRASTTGGDE